MSDYELGKWQWNDSDFPTMGWHDSVIWSTAPDPENFEFLVDLDYIFKWVQPREGETYFKFWVAPVTMVFANAHSVKVALDSSQGSIEVADLYRENPKLTANGKLTEHTYRFDCQEGEISLVSTGFSLFVRRAPSLLQTQCFTFQSRGGISFARERSVA